MRFSNFRISVRVSAGYGILILLLIGVISIAFSRIYAIRAESDHIVMRDWAALGAVNVIQTESRDAAARAVTLIIQNRKRDRVESYRRIDASKRKIDAEIAALEALEGTPSLLRLLAAVKRARTHYYDGFIAVADQVEAGNRLQAEQRMNDMALPALDELLASIHALNELQRRSVMERAARARADIDSSLLLMLGLGILAVLVGVAFAVSARTITRPLAKAIAIATRVANGDFSTDIEVTSKDETGELLQALKDMTAGLLRQAELRRAVVAAEDATKMKSNFLANMSHEIRTPMNGIIGMTHLALQTALTSKQRNYLERVESAADHLLGIVNDILDFSKIEAGKLHFEQVNFFLEDVMQQLVELSLPRAQEKGLELLFDIGDEVPSELVGDPLRLGQVLINLTNNAVKFTPHGEVVVSVRVQHRAAAALTLRIDVRDTGVGLSMTQRDSLFQAFTQADGSTTRLYGGTGLGLSISKRLVEMMGGEIGVDSVPGEGSTFHFTARFGVAEPSPLSRGDPSEVAGLRVLVVDDNASARHIFSKMLKSLHFDVEVAEGGEHAMDIVARARACDRRFDLVLIDWQMPGMSGLETIARLRLAADDGSSPEFIVITVRDRDLLLEDERFNRVGAILNKPVSASTLLDTILTVFGKDVTGWRRARRADDYRQAGDALRGAHVLLVEDNEINQEVAVELLEMAGVRVDVAANGAMALAKLCVNRYDGVLMDCQMPVMDGFETTRRLRSGGNHARLPVIAMTANAMMGDRERCIAAGMNDFIAKPIDVAQLFATMARWIAPAQPAAAAPGPVAAAGRLPLVDGLNLHSAMLRLGGSSTLMRRLLSRFAATQGDAAARIAAAVGGNDVDAAVREAHTLRGLAGNIGANGIVAAALRLEQMLRRGELDGMDAALAALVGELDALLPRIELALVESPGEPARERGEGVDRGEMAVALRQLEQLLSQDDAGALNLMARVEASLARAGQGEHAHQLRRLINQYDFEAALEQLREVALALDIELEKRP